MVLLNCRGENNWGKGDKDLLFNPASLLPVQKPKVSRTKLAEDTSREQQRTIPAARSQDGDGRDLRSVIHRPSFFALRLLRAILAASRITARNKVRSFSGNPL